MNFADCLKLSAPPPAAAPTTESKSVPSLQKSLMKAGLGIVGLLALPFLTGHAPSAPAIKMVGALVAICGLAYLALRLLAKRGLVTAADKSALKVVARASLSPKNGVAILEADGRRYVVAFGDGFTTVISGEPR
ncbi:MAG: flagellar biosynthetic protein FliO [Myxococcales bacterium]